MSKHYEASAHPTIPPGKNYKLLQTLTDCALELCGDDRQIARAVFSYPTEDIPFEISRRYLPSIIETNPELTEVTIFAPKKKPVVEFASMDVSRYARPIEPNPFHFRFSRWKLRYTAITTPGTNSSTTTVSLSASHTNRNPLTSTIGLQAPSPNLAEIADHDISLDAIDMGDVNTVYRWPPTISEPEIAGLLSIANIAIKMGRRALG